MEVDAVTTTLSHICPLVRFLIKLALHCKYIRNHDKINLSNEKMRSKIEGFQFAINYIWVYVHDREQDRNDMFVLYSWYVLIYVH